MAVPSRPPTSGLPEFGILSLAEVGNIRLRLAGRVDRMSGANAGGVGGLILLRASKSPPTRLASLATLPANGREGKGFRAVNRCVHPLAPSRGRAFSGSCFMAR